MSITQGVTGEDSYSGVRTLRWNRGLLGIPYHSRGRNWNLVGFATNRQLTMAALSLPVMYALGATLWPARAIKVLGSPLFWAAHNLYQEAGDIYDWARGEDMSWQIDKRWRPIFGPHPMFGPVVIPLPFPYLDFSKSPSSGGGGPGELPKLRRPPPSIEEAGEILSNPPMAGGKVQNGHGIDPQFGKWGSPMHAAEWIRDDDGYHWICPTTHRLKKIHGRWMCIKKG